MNESLQNQDKSEPPRFDEIEAASMIGKYILIGITYYDHDDNFIEHKQFHGNIVSADQMNGIVVRTLGNQEETICLPPDFRAFQKAKPGEYHLKSTGEIVEDPDFLVTWRMNKPDPNSEGYRTFGRFTPKF